MILMSNSVKIESFLSFESFKSTIKKTLEKYSPLKKWHVKA